jgi:hypothetical protein
MRSVIAGTAHAHSSRFLAEIPIGARAQWSAKPGVWDFGIYGGTDFDSLVVKSKIKY